MLERPSPVLPALVIRPEVLLERAHAAYHAEDRTKAHALCQRILRADPLHAEALNLLGVLAAEEGRVGEAIGHFDNALRIQPDLLDAWLNRGNALSDLGLFEEALASFDAIVAHHPAHDVGPFHRGLTLARMGRFAEALTAYDEVPQRCPPDAALAANRGLPLLWTGRETEAAASFDLALALDPGLDSVRVNKGMMSLLRGDLPAGLRLLEHRTRPAPPSPESGPPSKPWLGEADPAGRTILLYAEQGFGDALQFCRYVPLVAQAGARVILRVPASLVDLMADLPGVSRLVTPADPMPDHDLRCPLESLPLAFGTTLATIPANGPYLRADPARAAIWRARLAGLPGFRVGLVWAGAARPGNAVLMGMDRRRSVPPAALAPLGSVVGYSFVSLQHREARAPASPVGFALHDAAAELGSFADTAAAVENLDLVIAVDTAVAHLAGAMGKPVWLLNRFDTCWRWLLGRDDSPWYPTLRQFRQTTPGDWAGVVGRVAEALRVLAAACPSGARGA